MEVKDVEQMLMSIEKEGVKSGWSIIDTKGDKTYGLNGKSIQAIAKSLEKDACLADELYRTNNHDLKYFATLIDDPESYSRDEIFQRLDQLSPSPFGESFCEKVLVKTIYAVDCLDLWEGRGTNDDLACMYYALSALAKQKNNLSDDFFIKYFENVEFSSDENEALQIALSNAFEAVSKRNSELKKKVEKISDSLSESPVADSIDRKLKIEASNKVSES